MGKTDYPWPVVGRQKHTSVAMIISAIDNTNLGPAIVAAEGLESRSLRQVGLHAVRCHEGAVG